MAESSRISNRSILLAINLVLLVVCIAGMILVIVLYPTIQSRFFRTAQSSLNTLRPSLTWSPIPTITQTPTTTRTPRPVASSTVTLTPTQTETPTETSTGTNFPTLTPALASVLSNSYELIAWSPASADYMVQLMQGFPATIGSATVATSSQAYFQAFEIPIFALRESLLRFPGASQADPWAWTLAFDLALAGKPEAGDQYANLIAGALNRDQTDISQLYAWFQLKEPRMSFFMVEADIPPGFISSYLIELRCAGGSALIRLLEKNRVFRTESLYANFDFVNPREVNWILADLNGNAQDGNEIAFYSSSASSETLLEPPHVFNLFREQAVELPFIPAEKIFQVGMDFTNYWSVQSLPAGGNDLVFQALIFPACPVKLQRVYHWNELYFKLVKQEYGFDTLPRDLSACETMIDHAAYFWGPAVAADLMDSLTAKWPPILDQDGKPYPADAKDEWLYRLGVYRALAGDDRVAVELFDQVSTEPTVPTSRWIIPAQDFLAVWQKPEDIYTACQAAKFCYPADAIKSLVRMLPTLQTATSDGLDTLRKWGVTTTSSGYFDFDRDDEAERWFTVRYFPREKLSFWILAKKGRGYTALEIKNLDSSRPTLDYIPEAFIADEALQYQPAILLDGSVAFSMQRFPDTQEPYLVDIPLRKEYPSRFFVPLERYKEALLNGSPPEIIQINLQDLQDDPGLLCKPTWSCDEYYYTLGLAGELARDDLSAIQAFQRLWLDYSKSPFTSMARLKLILVATPLAPVTPSLTPSPSSGPVTPTTTQQTLTFTPTGTRGTSTITPPRGTFTPTISPTPTITGTPPTATPSPSPTLTEDSRSRAADQYPGADKSIRRSRKYFLCTSVINYLWKVTQLTFPPKKWRLICTRPAHGSWNMAVDEAILESVIAGNSPATLRLYAWEPACLSLGYAQPVADVEPAALEKRGFELVRRPTGGRAILHGDELTYSVIGTERDPRLAGGVLESYCNLSLALLEALRLLGIPAQALEKPPSQKVPTENMTVGNSPAHKTVNQNPVCFEVPSNYEITSGGKKLVGSAQARRKVGVLQHGTLLLYGDLTRIIQVLKFRDVSARERAASRLLERATTAEAASGRIISWEEAAQAYVQAFTSVLNLELEPGELAPTELSRADQLVVAKYTHPIWTERV